MKKVFKRTLAILLVAIMLFSTVPIMASATSIDDLEYSIYNGKVTITDCNETASGELVIPSKIDGYPVTSIGNYAFYNCRSLKNITIPDSVTSIGDWAFYYCESLESITIPDSVTYIDDSAFFYCTSLKSITIPDGVSSIEDYTFENCSSLTSITIPDSVTSIGGVAFSYCYSLTDVYYNGTEE